MAPVRRKKRLISAADAEKAISEQEAFEGQISDERKIIAAKMSAVSVSEANIQSTEAAVERRS